MNRRKTKIITLAQQKGGCGKTSSTVALARSLGAIGHRVLVVDWDFQGNASTSLGLQDAAMEQRRTITEAIRQGLTLDAIRMSTANPQVDLLASDISMNAETRRLAGSSRQFTLFRKILDCPALDEYSFVLTDTHPSIDCTLEAALAFSDAFLVPTFPEKHSYDGLSYLTQTVTQIREDFNRDLYCLGVFITNYRRDNATHRALEAKIRELQVEALPVFRTVIPHSHGISSAAARQQPLAEHLPVTTAYMELAKELLQRIEHRKIEAPIQAAAFDGSSF